MQNHKKRPLQIGVTGGIGSGKSIVCKVFSCLGIPIYEADSRAKWLTNNNLEIRSEIIALLGPESYNTKGQYDTSFVASVVFKNETLLKKLNAIIHPAVMRDTEEWISEKADKAYVIKEAAIMNKAGDRNSLDYVIVVEAPVELRVKRILLRDNRSEEEVRAIIQRQVSDEDRDKISDFIITNDDQLAIIPQVLQLHKLFVK